MTNTDHTPGSTHPSILDDPTRTGAAGQSRAVKIATIHALADWFAQHPEHPMPDRLICARDITFEDEADEATRMAALESWAKANDITVNDTTSTYQAWALLIIADRNLHGMTVSYMMNADKARA
jgi:hypothetical protein